MRFNVTTFDVSEVENKVSGSQGSGYLLYEGWVGEVPVCPGVEISVCETFSEARKFRPILVRTHRCVNNWLNESDLPWHHL